MYEEITASCLIKVDLAGNILSKPDFGALDYGINTAGYVIHSAVHEARPEVGCVIHTHSLGLDGGLARSSAGCCRSRRRRCASSRSATTTTRAWCSNDAEKESLLRRPRRRARR